MGSSIHVELSTTMMNPSGDFTPLNQSQ